MLAWQVNLVIVVAFISLFSLGRAQKNKNELLASKDVGNTLFSAYRSVFTKQNESSLREKLPPNLRFNASIAQCISDFYKLTSNEKRQYIDAAGKPNSGLYLGNNLWFGSVAECRNITNAHYCLSTFSITMANTTIPQIIWGACFPASCDTNGVYVLLTSIIFPIVKKAANVDIHLLSEICPPKPRYTTGVIITLGISGIVLFLCLIGTVIDLVIEAPDNYKADNSPFSIPNETPQLDGNISAPQLESQLDGSTANLITQDEHLPRSYFCWVFFTILNIIKGIFCDVFLCFSLVRNTKKIFNTDVPSTAITSINGVRVMSISWVILGHAFVMFITSTLTEDKVIMSQDYKLLSIMPVINGYYSVDSFFFLSGLLVAYTCMRKLQKNGGGFNWILFYVHRFLRLTPSYMYVILFSMYLKRFLSDGPLSYQMYEDKQCEKYWWTNLLYINNFYPTTMGKECFVVSWYLANDMQFFMIALPLLLLLYKFGWRAVFVPLTMIGLSSIVIASLFAHYKLDALGQMKFSQLNSPALQEKQAKFVDYVYNKPYCRIQPYLVGFILGYAMHMNFRRMQKPGWIITLVGWSVAFATGMGLVYGPHDSILPGARQWTEAENVLYGTFQRLLWGLVLAWVTYACHYCAGGLVQKFLSAKFWIPLSRLTYSVYLIHFIVLPVLLMGGLGTIHYDINTVSYYFIAAIVLSYGAGFILAVCIEFPCDNLENLAIRYIKSRFNSTTRNFVERNTND